MYKNFALLTRWFIHFRRSYPSRFNGMALFFVLAFSGTSAAQENKTVAIMDFVKIRDGKTAEALFFYENNWKVYRDQAIRKNVIQSYELVQAAPDTLNNFDLVLVTVYKDSAQYANSEEKFRPILKELRPNGPLLLNDLKPDDFRKNVFVKIVRPVYSSVNEMKRK